MTIWQFNCHFGGVMSVLDKKCYICVDHPLKPIKMALIKYTAAVDAISGKLNGTVFSKNKGGAYARSRGQVLNPKTNRQSFVRSAFGGISRMWSDLTEAQRKGWNDGAPEFPYTNRLGDQKVYAGKALFQKLNLNLNALGEDPILSIPAPDDVVGFKNQTQGLAAETDEATGQLTPTFIWLLSRQAANTQYILEATPPLSPGTSNANNRFRQIAVSEGVTPEKVILTEKDFADDAEALGDMITDRFGTYAAGKAIQIRIRPVNSVTGQAGVAAKGSTIITEDTAG